MATSIPHKQHERILLLVQGKPRSNTARVVEIWAWGDVPGPCFRSFLQLRFPKQLDDAASGNELVLGQAGSSRLLPGRFPSGDVPAEQVQQFALV